MTLRQFECFVAVAEEGSFTRAARRVGISQPSLSQHIRALEAELGGLLFDRLPRSVSLTPAGRTLLPEARVAVRAVERGWQNARSVLALEAGELEIATVLSLAVGLLPRHIRVWHERHPNVAIRLHEFRHRVLLEDAVEQGVADFALGPRPVRRWEGPLEVVGWEEFVLVSPSSEPLARQRSITLEDVRDRDWVLYHPDHGLAGVVEAVCRQAGFRPRGTVRTSQAEGAVRLAAAGLGIALVPDNIVLRELDCAVLRVEPHLVREVAVYARAPWSPTAEAFVDVLRAEARPLPPGAQIVHL
ncbi:MAG TPA: LysR family transcriptional regulator [Gaiellaceae bacterium]|nr:LysR family transcriptional regulator [Gaiellaceae bacterium]